MSCNTNVKIYSFRSARHNMSSMIAGWLVRDWDLNKKSQSQLNLKRGNPVLKTSNGIQKDNEHINDLNVQRRLSKISVKFKTQDCGDSQGCKKQLSNKTIVPCDIYRSDQS